MVFRGVYAGTRLPLQYVLGARDPFVVGPSVAEVRETYPPACARERCEPRGGRSTVHIDAQTWSQNAHLAHEVCLVEDTRAASETQDPVDIGLALKHLRETLLHGDVDPCLGQRLAQ